MTIDSVMLGKVILGLFVLRVALGLFFPSLFSGGARRHRSSLTPLKDNIRYGKASRYWMN